jgi:GH35 family endo-1,4-beta-xylanase
VKWLTGNHRKYSDMNVRYNAIELRLFRFLILVAGAAGAQTFDGVDEASRPVMEQARKRIETTRKGNFRVLLNDDSGKPYTGAASIRLTRHAFRFGASAYGIPRLPENARRRALDVIDELFNTVTITNYWPENEPTRSGDRIWKDADWMVDWATTHEKTMRFHSMFFPWPKWVAEVETTAEWWRIVEARIRAVAERYGTRIHEYDILNEIASRAWIWNKDMDPTRDSAVFPRFVETPNAVRCFQIARRYLPDAELVNNDQTIATPASENLALHLKFNRDLLAAGAPIDVFGHQAHFYASGQMPFQEGHSGSGKGAFTMAVLDQGFDRMGSLGKPVHITEFSPPSRDNKRQGPQPRLSDEEVAAWQANYYTLAFSKPFVHEITRWFVVDELGGRGIDAGLITKDGKLKPSCYALRKLLKDTWKTSWEGPVRNGEMSFRGFYGEYEVVAPGYRALRFSVRPDTVAPIVVKLSR